MSARDITPAQLSAIDAAISRPPCGNPHRARTRQTVTTARMIAAVDVLIAEAAEARIAANGLLEIREWLVFNVESNVADAMEARAAQ